MAKRVKQVGVSGGVSFIMVGEEDIIRELRELAERYRSKGERKKIMRPSAQWLRDKEREFLRNYPWRYRSGDSDYAAAYYAYVRRRGRMTGNLAKSIRVFSFPKSGGMHVGARVGKNEGSRLADGYYFGWVDLGTSSTGKGGPGIRPRHLVRAVMLQYGQQAARKMMNAFEYDLRHFTGR